jgi:hypothetical protein
MDLNDYLKLNSNAIVDMVERKYVPDAFEELAGLLQGIFVHRHGSEEGKRDKAHNVLAEAILCSLWCGWLSQAIANKGAYPQEWVDSFKKLIVDAFEIGQSYSNDQP